MKHIDTFYVRHQVPPGADTREVAKAGLMDLRQAARQMGLTLQSEPKARLIPDGALPQVEVWAHIPPRITKPKPPVFDSADGYLQWRRSDKAAA